MVVVTRGGTREKPAQPGARLSRDDHDGATRNTAGTAGARAELIEDVPGALMARDVRAPDGDACCYRAAADAHRRRHRSGGHLVWGRTQTRPASSSRGISADRPRLCAEDLSGRWTPHQLGETRALAAYRNSPPTASSPRSTMAATWWKRRCARSMVMAGSRRCARAAGKTVARRAGGRAHEKGRIHHLGALPNLDGPPLLVHRGFRPHAPRRFGPDRLRPRWYGRSPS